MKDKSFNIAMMVIGALLSVVGVLVLMILNSINANLLTLNQEMQIANKEIARYDERFVLVDQKIERNTTDIKDNRASIIEISKETKLNHNTRP